MLTNDQSVDTVGARYDLFPNGKKLPLSVDLSLNVIMVTTTQTTTSCAACARGEMTYNDDHMW